MYKCICLCTLQQDSFNQFLASIKRLNNQQQSREDTLAEARQLFGAQNEDLYFQFENLLNSQGGHAYMSMCLACTFPWALVLLCFGVLVGSTKTLYSMLKNFICELHEVYTKDVQCIQNG